MKNNPIQFDGPLDSIWKECNENKTLIRINPKRCL